MQQLFALDSNHEPVIIDDFDNPQSWLLSTTDGVSATIAIVEDGTRKALRLDYDFCGRAGYAAIRKRVDLTLPENFLFTFDLRAQSPKNSLEMKLIDSSGENVWWLPRPSLTFPQQWATLANKARQISYAWGPNKERLTQVAFIELVVSASTGGKGTIYFDTLTFRALPKQMGWHKPAVTATSGQETAARLLDQQGQPQSSWRSTKSDTQAIVLDYQSDIEFGGLSIEWGKHYATQFSVSVKGAGSQDWKEIYRVDDNRNRRSLIYLPESEGSSIRLQMERSVLGQGYKIKRLAVEPLSFSSSGAQFWRHVAASHQRGRYPRYLDNQQSFWTIAGAFGDSKKALINEEGMIEVEKLGFSLEPFIYNGRRLLGWGDGTHKQSLHEGWMPIPSVVRQHDSLELTITPIAAGKASESVLYAQYQIRNTSNKRKTGTMFLAVRPFQVNPPWQFLNAPGGFSPITKIAAGANALKVNGNKDVISLTPCAAGVTRLERGDIVEWLEQGELPQCLSTADRNGFASAAFAFPFRLKPKQECTFVVAVPFHPGQTSLLDPAAAKQQVIDFWTNKFAPLQLKLPDAAKELEQTIKAQLAYIMVNRNGPRIQPGTRCYDRSWARDGALTSCALLEFGFTPEVRQFIDWFAPYQFEDGKIPCAVDDRGADPTPEHDSPGEFIFLIAEYYRYTKDKQFLSEMFPRVVKTVGYIEKLLDQTSGQAFATPEKQHLRGLLPPSISHEGYSDNPAYSYWDDFWCLRGLEDAVFLAEANSEGTPEITARLTAARDRFKSNLFASIHLAMRKHKLAGIPGAADRGDFDPCSTTIAVDPGALTGALGPELRATFDLWWKHFTDRKEGKAPWDNYTPYELRFVGTLLRLGSPEKAHEALDWYMQHRRPLGWKHWGEVVHRDPLTPKFIGDMPHGWVASDFLRSARSLLVYERADAALVVGAGFRPEWLNGADETKFALPTPHGTLSVEIAGTSNRKTVKLTGTVSADVVLQMPLADKKVTVNGKPVTIEYQLGKLPAEVVIEG